MPITCQRSCPVCGGAENDALYENIMAPIGGIDLSYSVARCRSCGFSFAARLPCPRDYSHYYATFSKYDFSEKVSAIDAARFKAAVSLCLEVADPTRGVADLGCAQGGLLAEFQAAGFVELFGLDPAPRAAECARERYGLTNVFRGMMQDVALIPLERVDLICVMAVLEHLWSPAGDIGKLLDQLHPGCKIMVEVPALEYFATDQGEPYGELSLEHIQFFSKYDLDVLMQSIGAKPLVHRYAYIEPASATSLFAVYEKSIAKLVEKSASHDGYLENYIKESRKRFELALAKINVDALVIYGAGSHSARLLPILEKRGIKIELVVDANPNLQGVTLGRYRISHPGSIGSHPDLPVLISSYRSQRQIADYVKANFANRVIEMY